MIFTELTKNEYDTFARKHTYRNFLNALSAFEMKAESGFTIAFVGVKQDDTLIAACGIAFVQIGRAHV